MLQVVITHLAGDDNWLADHLSRRHKYWKTLQQLDLDKEVCVDLEAILGCVWC